MPDKEDYDPKLADYNLRETISNIKGQIDQVYFGFLDKLKPDKKAAFIARLKTASDQLYSLLSEAILEKAKNINMLHRLILEDLQMARKIQQEILNCELPDQCPLHIPVCYQPMSEVGGDLYNIFELKPGYFRIFMADATGHGVQAALITMLIKSEYELIKTSAEKPRQILESLNRVFYTTFGKLSVFFTGVAVDIDTLQQKLYYSSAGHPGQYLIRNEALIQLKTRGMIVGAIPETTIDELEEDFCPGDKLLLFTDGIFEEFSPDEEEYGEERLEITIKQHASKAIKQCIDAVLQDVRLFLRDNSWNDDTTIIGVEYAGDTAT